MKPRKQIRAIKAKKKRLLKKGELMSPSEIEKAEKSISKLKEKIEKQSKSYCSYCQRMTPSTNGKCNICRRGK